MSGELKMQEVAKTLWAFAREGALKAIPGLRKYLPVKLKMQANTLGVCGQRREAIDVWAAHLREQLDCWTQLLCGAKRKKSCHYVTPSCWTNRDMEELRAFDAVDTQY